MHTTVLMCNFISVMLADDWFTKSFKQTFDLSVSVADSFVIIIVELKLC